MKFFSFLFFCFFTHVGWSQVATLDKIGPLPASLNEASGIELSSDQFLWLHNDSGSKPLLYKTDKEGTIIKTLYLKGADYIDYEDIAKDRNGNYYLGDFGNNSQNRADLVIYKMGNIDQLTGDSVTLEAIEFSYAAQQNFPSTSLETDCEAMIHMDGHLYLFSKNMRDKSRTSIYKLPDTPGNYSLLKVGELFVDGTIRAATISPDGHSLALISESFMMLYWGFSGDDFDSGNVLRIPYLKSKKEGAVFINNTEIYMVDDGDHQNTTPNIYRMDLSDLYKKKEILDSPFSLAMYPNPSKGFVTIGGNSEVSSIEIFSKNGQHLKTIEINNGASNMTIDLNDLNSGAYFLNVRTDDAMITRQVFITTD